MNRFYRFAARQVRRELYRNLDKAMKNRNRKLPKTPNSSNANDTLVGCGFIMVLIVWIWILFAGGCQYRYKYGPYHSDDSITNSFFWVWLFLPIVLFVLYIVFPLQGFKKEKKRELEESHSIQQSQTERKG